jgi:hypothetical protein
VTCNNGPIGDTTLSNTPVSSTIILMTGHVYRTSYESTRRIYVSRQLSCVGRWIANVDPVDPVDLPQRKKIAARIRFTAAAARSILACRVVLLYSRCGFVINFYHFIYNYNRHNTAALVLLLSLCLAATAPIYIMLFGLYYLPHAGSYKPNMSGVSTYARRCRFAC